MRKIAMIKHCRICQTEFQPKRRDKVYCSSFCKKKAQRVRHPEYARPDALKLNKLPVQERLSLYDEALRLRTQGLHVGEIASKFNIRDSVISRWLSGKKNPHNKLNSFIPTASPDLAWLLGLLFGDGSIRWKRKAENGKIHKYAVVQLQLGRNGGSVINRSLDAVEKVTGKHPTIYRFNHPLSDEKHYGWELCLQSFYEYLKPFWDTSDLDSFKDVISTHPMDFLRGLYEAEGWTYFQRHKYRMIGVTNTNERLVELTRDILLSNGWHPNIYRREPHTSVYKGHTIKGNRPTFMIRLTRQAEVAEFLRATGLGKRGDAKWSTAAK